MASDEMQMQDSGRGRRGRRPSPGPATDGSPSMLRLLLADLRKQPIPSEPDLIDLEEFEAEQEYRAQRAARVGTVRSIGAEKLDDLRRRYWTGPGSGSGA